VTTSPSTSAARASLGPVASYLPFVRRIVSRLARRLPSHVQLEDLVSAGVVGLLEAMERFDPERVTEFESYAEFRIKGAVLDELRERDIMARDARSAAKQYEAAVLGLTRELNREPDEDEVAARLGLTVDELRQKLERLTPVRVVSLEDLYSVSLPSQEDGPFEAAAKQQLVSRLTDAMGQLGERHRQVLHLYYRESLTLKEIGFVLGVTESRACQLMSEATLRLRSLIGAGREGEAGSPARPARKVGGYHG
jgi:RNA polymerase sigma factor for flagellar operon FliA